MATIKKGALANIVFPMVDGTDFASVESGLTASDFESKVTKRYIGVTHGNSTAASTGTISKTITLVRSGIFQQTLNETETDFDYLMLSFEPSNTSLAHQILVFHPVDYDDSDIFSQLSDIGSNLLSYLTGMSGAISDVESQLDLVATSNYLSAVHSDLTSQIGDIGTGTVTASDISDIVSAVWAGSYSVLGAGASSFGSLIWGTVSSRVSDIQSYLAGMSNTISTVYELVSDVDSALTLHDANMSALVSDVGSDLRSYLVGMSGMLSDTYSLVSDVDSQLLLTASLVSDIDSQLLLNASMISDTQSAVAALNDPTAAAIADAVWNEPYSDHLTASTIGSRVQFIVSSISDVDSALTLHDANMSNAVSDVRSYLVGMSGALSDVESQVDLLATSNYLSQVHSDLYSAIGNVSVTLTQSDISDIASATAAAISTISGSDISNIASAVWSEKYNVYSATNSSFGSFFTQQIQGASNLLSGISGLVSDVDSQLLVTHSLLSDVDSQVNLLATSNYLSQVHSDLYSAVGAITAGVSASDISDIASAVWANTVGARVDSRVVLIQSNVSDIDSQLTVTHSLLSDVESAVDALSIPAAATIADAVWDEPYSDHLTASTVGSRLQKVVSDISDLDSALTVHDANISGMISDVDSQLTVNYNLISDVESQLDLTASTVSDIESQLDVTHSLLSDVESAVDGIWTTALTESYNADGSAATAAQLLYGIMQNLTEFSINSTTITVKKLDGSTTAMTFTLDDGTNPTSRTRAT